MIPTGPNNHQSWREVAQHAKEAHDLLSARLSVGEATKAARLEEIRLEASRRKEGRKDWQWITEATEAVGHRGPSSHLKVSARVATAGLLVPLLIPLVVVGSYSYGTVLTAAIYLILPVVIHLYSYLATSDVLIPRLKERERSELDQPRQAR